MTSNSQDVHTTDWNDLIADHPLFEGVTAKERLLLLSDDVSQKHEIDAGTVILKQGDKGNSLFVICTGTVVVRIAGPDGKLIDLYTLTEGEVFGEMALFGQILRAATLVAAEPCNLLEIEGNPFIALMKKHHEIAVYMLAKLSQRLNNTNNMMISRRVSGFDSAIAELQGRIESITETTDAKLTAAQTVFDQTKQSAQGIIDSAGRWRTRITWMASTATVFLGLAASVGFLNFKGTQQEIENTAAEIESAQKEIGRIRINIEKAQADVNKNTLEIIQFAESARNFAERAKNSADTAGDSVKRATDSAIRLDDMARLAQDNAESLLGLNFDANLGLLKAKLAENVDDVTDEMVRYYTDCINANVPKLRMKLRDFLHLTIIERINNLTIMQMLKDSLKTRGSELSNDARVATYYFIAFASIIENNAVQSLAFARYIETASQNRDYYQDVFGGSEFNSNDFIAVVLLNESDEGQQQKQKELEQLFSKFQPSN